MNAVTHWWDSGHDLFIGLRACGSGAGLPLWRDRQTLGFIELYLFERAVAKTQLSTGL